MQFLNAKNVCEAEIYRHIVEVCCEGAVNEENVTKWCLLFKEGRTNVQDEEGGGLPSFVTGGLKENLNANFRKTGDLQTYSFPYRVRTNPINKYIYLYI
jgi:hypothetical protein